jgi:hypothetical protein
MTGRNDNVQGEIEKVFSKGIFETLEELERQIEDNNFLDLMLGCPYCSFY